MEYLGLISNAFSQSFIASSGFPELRFAYYGHHRPQDDGMYHSPKKIAEAMGHEYETHLLSYARFNTKDLAKSFDQYPVEIN